MKKIALFKIVVTVLALSMISFSASGCFPGNSGQMRVITNQDGKAGSGTAVQNNEQPGYGVGRDQGGPGAEEGKNRGSGGTGVNGGTTAGGGNGETGGGSLDGGESEEKATGGVAYKGYKGPVQGEVRYKEGTPAGENARGFKASGDIESPYKVDLIVTRDFGHQKMFARTVGLVRDEVGMEVMFRNLDIQTAYGGGFVNAINGLESGYTFFTGQDRKKHDWFYWVNGILSPVGVAEYRPQPGDVIWWDYHDWSMTMFIPAVIGSYPQPFKSGFWGKNPGTVVMHTPEYREDAMRLKRSLEAEGVKQVDTAAFDPEVLKVPKKYYIVLGLWDKLTAECGLLREINTRNKLVGVYVKFADGELKALDFKGNVVSSHSRAGAVYAYGAFTGSLNPVWVVTATDDEGLRLALNTLINSPGDIKEHFGAVVTKDGVINVPYVN
ncbi:MAG: DUF4430 domain-containing protein [Peptococcaceae bacterium]|nr:DUF4430 domain-containing protein [Peptococcaceae bacterium]